MLRTLVRLAAWGLVALPSAAVAAPQAAEPAPVQWRVSAQRPTPTFQAPERLAVAPDAGRSPVWTPEGVFANAPVRWRGLAKAERSGAAVYDPSTLAWYAAAVGAVVRVDADGRLPVVAQGVQGTDVDVRAARGLAVSREPDDRIVLHRFGVPGSARTVLLRGEFFHPRFSADGTRILVAESRQGESWFKVVDLTGRTVAQTRGSGAAWHPDGRRVVFQRAENDGYRVTASDLWQIDVASAREERVTATPGVREMNPTPSPDGRWLAYVDDATGDLCVAAFPLARR